MAERILKQATDTATDAHNRKRRGHGDTGVQSPSHSMDTVESSGGDKEGTNRGQSGDTQNPSSPSEDFSTPPSRFEVASQLFRDITSIASSVRATLDAVIELERPDLAGLVPSAAAHMGALADMGAEVLDGSSWMASSAHWLMDDEDRGGLEQACPWLRQRIVIRTGNPRPPAGGMQCALLDLFEEIVQLAMMLPTVARQVADGDVCLALAAHAVVVRIGCLADTGVQACRSGATPDGHALDWLLPSRARGVLSATAPRG